ncbi:MAG TPA: neutral/alkaline non-lysosomal ceramidase N-terminal domain-containing protein [Aeromicrobium sp.]|nr:neutral/alkaline non-lysosomal ceramidase N-terminal domain-containing protein [Aeromicrobium sp.]
MRVGRGIADITGEPADCGMLGYGKAEQRTAGIHLRLRSRAFVFDDGDRRVLLVVAELPLPMQSVTDGVLSRLADRFGDRYVADNTLITTTHTHAGPGGYCGHLLYNLTTRGFHPRTFEAIVAGIVESVEHADADLAPSEVALAHGELRDASANRSPTAFARNPEKDRAVFPDGIDPQTSLVRIDRDGRPVGAINFFATHGTSMTNRNTLISGDNKGYAAYHWERLVEGDDYLAGQPAFIAAFAQTNPGDMTPNVNRRDGIGPTPDEVENTRIIGRRQYDAAAGLLTSATDIGDTVDARLTYVDLGAMKVRPEFTPDERQHRTGPPMAAASQIAGTDDGAGFPGFRQGRNPLLDRLSSVIYRRNERLRDAHAPKGLVAPAGLLNRVAPFVQERVPVQLLRIGRLHLIAIPGEPTIVSGLRLRRTVATIVGASLQDVLCVGYSNAYMHYVTTPEEYDEQRYEGGSTLFGRWELPALMQVAADLAVAMRNRTPIETGEHPGTAETSSWLREPGEDAGEFGRVTVEPRAEYGAGDVVHAGFVSANPNHDLRRGGTYLEVQRREGGEWVRIADDGDWATTFRWRRAARKRPKSSESTAAITWHIPEGTLAGDYRIVHHGTARTGDGLMPFTASSREFRVT